MKFKVKYFFTILFHLLFVAHGFSQKGKHGAVVISAVNTKINEFTNLTANASSGNSTITVANSALNSNLRFASNLQVGDLIMIIQMQGAVIRTFTDVPSQDSTYGEILNYDNAGNYEFAQVFSIPNLTSIVLDCGLQNNYSLAGKVQIVRVPRYSSLIVNGGASITTDAWNGTVGGIVAAEVNGLTTINGTITSTGMGFRGGLAVNNSGSGGSRFVDLGGGQNEGGEKGESIAGSVTDYSLNYGGPYAKGAPANGGGGGDSHNAGGGGGANAGNKHWYGQGMIDPSYTLAYSQEYPNRETVISSGGGKGGYCYSTANLDPTLIGPGAVIWGGDSRRNEGGLGGRPLDYSFGKLFIGGGGGAGHVTNLGGGNIGGTGGAGGGMIFFETYDDVAGTGVVSSDGADGTTSTGPNPGPLSSVVNGVDGAGGGGGGGTVIFSTSSAVNGITINANGGLGGNQIIEKGGLAAGNTEAEGPGGGGGGGYIAISSGAPVQNVLGAIGGTTNSSPMLTFPPNGSSNGDDGLKDQVIKLNVLSTTNATVCVGSSATLVASTNATAASFFWYNAIAGPSQIGTGSAFTTSVFTTPGSYTVYAEMCPGNYREPAIITVVANPTITASSTTICAVQTITLSASGATTYTWSTGSNSSTTAVTPTAATVYTVEGTNAGCSAQTTLSVDLQALPSFTLSSTSNTLCSNQTITINTSGTAGTYSWSNGAGNTPSINVLVPGVFTSTLSNFCGDAVHTLTIVAGPPTTLNLASSESTICTGGTVTLTASGTGTFAWSTTTVNASSVTVSTSGNYFVTLTNFCGTSNSSISIGNGPQPTINIVPATSVFCVGQTATLIIMGSATSYSWSTGSTSPTFTTDVSANYSVAASNSCGVTNAIVTVTFQNSPDISVTENKLFICPGDSAKLYATNFSGGGFYSWSSSSNTTSIETVTAGGDYTAMYTNGCGVATASISLAQSVLVPDFNFAPGSGVVPLAVTFTNTSFNDIFDQWNFGNGQTSSSTNGNALFTVPGTYSVNLVIHNFDGCSASVTKTIEVSSITFGPIPEVITPNGDGKNETFKISGIETYPNNELQIYNRWGDLVYSMKAYNNSFNGMPNYKSNVSGKLPSGTYFYILNLGDSTNKVYNGFIEIVY